MISKTYIITVDEIDNYKVFKYKLKAKTRSEALAKAYYKYGAFVRNVVRERTK